MGESGIVLIKSIWRVYNKYIDKSTVILGRQVIKNYTNIELKFKEGARSWISELYKVHVFDKFQYQQINSIIDSISNLAGLDPFKRGVDCFPLGSGNWPNNFQPSGKNLLLQLKMKVKKEKVNITTGNVKKK